MSVEVKDHSDEALKLLKKKKEAALEAIGNQCVSHAKNNITASIPRGDNGTTTSALKNSIDHRVVMGEEAVYVGSNEHHAIYNEYGTGRFAESGGRQGWWVYVKGGGKKGTNTGKVYSYDEAKKIMAILKSKGLDAHMTEGITPTHFLKKAVEEHSDEYKAIIQSSLNS